MSLAVDTQPLPIWARPRVRGGLLALLLVGALVLLVAHSQAGSADDGCWIAEGPTAIQLRAGAVAVGVRRLGLTALAHPEQIAEAGLMPTTAAFAGGRPAPIDLTAEPSRPVSAGYGVRWFRRDGDELGAAAFRLPTPNAAAAWVAAAASTHCRPGTSPGRVGAPARARGLIRADPAGHLETDVFLARGPTAWWLLDVPARNRPPDPHSPAARAALARTAALACRLPAAGCAKGQAPGR